MTLENLLEFLEFDSQDSSLILSVSDGLTDEERQDFYENLSEKNNFENAEKRLIARLLPDERGLKILKVMLETACFVSYEKYRDKGISQKVFIDTMKCFSRFSNEYKTQNGVFGFDRSFWTGRQLSLMLFRIGELEYELTKTDDLKPIVYMHVPSGSDLSVSAIERSVSLAGDFIKEKFPEYFGAEYIISSWLLSPSLKEVLPKTSKILAFQRLFEITKTAPSDGYKFWVYGSNDIAPAEFAEDTTLQRGIKNYVLSGKVFLSAEGVFKQKV